MNRKQIDYIWMGVSIFFFFLLAISFMLMPLGSETPTESVDAYTIVAGLMFWVSLVMGIVAQCVLVHRRKAWYVIHRVRKVKSPQKIGLISFFKNKYATVADMATILSLAGLIIAMVVTRGSGYVCFVLASVFVFSFSLHCILNGKVYYHVVNQNKLLKAIEKERANSSKREREERNG